MNFTPPKFKLDGFNCPMCGTYSHMRWNQLLNDQNDYATLYYEATCSRCDEPSLWRVIDFATGIGGRVDKAGDLIYPDNGSSALPEEDMPEDVQKDYLEASSIVTKSPKGAAALLRLGLQKLCIHLGQSGENINTDIRNLAKENILPPLVIKVADTVRIVGNNAVHPGEMSDKDVDHVTSKMFELLNFIVKKGISEPKELEALYKSTPENPRKDAEAKDAKSRKN